jgi:hypothetical protein
MQLCTYNSANSHSPYLSALGFWNLKKNFQNVADFKLDFKRQKYQVQTIENKSSSSQLESFKVWNKLDLEKTMI